VQIYSSRSKTPSAIEAMMVWLVKYATEEWNATYARKFVDAFKFPVLKPAAFLTIDDRAICFQGKWDALDPKELLNFKPWWQHEPAAL
jgi:hypothetical protein